MIPALPPSRVRNVFFIEAGRASARYVQNGGRLRDIQMEEADLLHSPLQLTPAPLGERQPYPSRILLEQDLSELFSSWCVSQGTSIRNAFRFIFSFCGEMENSQSGWFDWVSVWITKQRTDHQRNVQQDYQFVLEMDKQVKSTFIAHWPSHPTTEAKVLHEMLEDGLKAETSELSHSQRAIVVQTELLGEDVIVKRYAENPKKWKQRWETSRARRAWAGSQVLKKIDLPAIRGIGWLEHYENGHLKESFFISHQLPAMETLRAWLRREFPKMSPSQRVEFRHRLRNEILKLHQHGLSHIDLKLSNILIQGEELKDLIFYWIDLEDLRPARLSRRTFIRNLYQLNGSLPRQIPLEERKAFLAGFQALFPFASSPKLLRYVQKKTQRRHRDELKRLQGA